MKEAIKELELYISLLESLSRERGCDIFKKYVTQKADRIQSIIEGLNEDS